MKPSLWSVCRELLNMPIWIHLVFLVTPDVFLFWPGVSRFHGMASIKGTPLGCMHLEARYVPTSVEALRNLVPDASDAKLPDAPGHMSCAEHRLPYSKVMLAHAFAASTGGWSDYRTKAGAR